MRTMYAEQKKDEDNVFRDIEKDLDLFELLPLKLILVHRPLRLSISKPMLHFNFYLRVPK